MSEDKNKNTTNNPPGQPVEIKIKVENSEAKSSSKKILPYLTNFVWALVFLIIAASLGKLLLFSKSNIFDNSNKIERTKPVLTTPDFAKGNLDDEIVRALKNARASTDSLASKKLQEWINGLMERVDNNFLEWHFGYFHQQMLGLKSLYQEALHYLFEQQPTAAEKLTEEFQEEFGRRVLRKEIAQMELEKISQEIVNHYFAELQNNLKDIPSRYKISQGEWDRYLNDIALIIEDAEGNRNVSLPIKTITVGSAGLTLVAAKTIGKTVNKVIAKMAAKTASKAGVSVASKAGAKVAAKMGGAMLGFYIGVGIIVWDLWDSYSTKKENEPILRQNIYDYLILMKDSILYDNESGIMTEIDRMINSVTLK